jgi:hypothetical protein
MANRIESVNENTAAATGSDGPCSSRREEAQIKLRGGAGAISKSEQEQEHDHDQKMHPLEKRENWKWDEPFP